MPSGVLNLKRGFGEGIKKPRKNCEVIFSGFTVILMDND